MNYDQIMKALDFRRQVQPFKKIWAILKKILKKLNLQL